MTKPTVNKLPGISTLLDSNNSRLPIFTLPTEPVIRKAIGEPVPGMFLPGTSFDPLPPPGPDDWLNQYMEDGQTFQSFLDADLDEPDQKREKIYILPIGSFAKEILDLNVIVEYMSVFFYKEKKANIQLLPLVEIFTKEEKLEFEKTHPIKRRSRKHKHREISLEQCDPLNRDAPIFHQPFPLSQERNEEDVRQHQQMYQNTWTLSNSYDSCHSRGHVHASKSSHSQHARNSEEPIMYLRIDNVMEPVTCRRAIDNNNIQMNISDILDLMETTVPDDAFCVIGVTLWDLFMDTSDLFVVGWAGYYCGLFSFARYDPLLGQSYNIETIARTLKMEHPHYSNTKVDFQQLDRIRKNIILKRSLKTVVHETLHLFGLQHCIYFSCLMNGTASLHEDDQAPMFLCPVCLRKLHYVVKFPVVQRYQRMLEFFQYYSQNYSFQAEVEWLTDRLKFLETCHKKFPDHTEYFRETESRHCGSHKNLRNMEKSCCRSRSQCTERILRKRLEDIQKDQADKSPSCGSVRSSLSRMLQ